MTEELSLDDFLTHGTRDGGRRGAYLDRWTKRKVEQGQDGPYVDTWLHTQANILALWQFPWPRIVERVPSGGQPDDPKVKEVWAGSFNSWESAAVLRRQYFVDRDTGEMDTPPQLCPMARLIAAVREAVRAGTISWVEPLFEFVGDDPRKGLVLHSGGMYAAYKKSDDLSGQQKAELKAAGIYLRDAWKESQMARCMYLMQVADNDEPQKGVQVAIVTQLLGDKVKGVINDAMDPKALGPDRGDPRKHPYCIRWMYLPNAKEFGKKYHARRLEGVALTDDVRHAIVDSPPRNVDRETKPGNIVELRLSVEKHYVGPKGALDFDAIFAPAERQLEAEGDPPEDEPEEQEQPARTGRTTQARNAARAVVGDLPGDEPDSEDEDQAEERAPARETRVSKPAPVEAETIYECDECGGPMKASETVCPACGKDYSEDEQPAPEPEPEPVKRPSRSEAKAAGRGPSPAPAATKPANGGRQAPGRFRPEPQPEPAPVRTGGGRRVKG